MKLLLVIQSLGGGGAERVLVSLANHWVRSGWSVTVLTFDGPDKDEYWLDHRCERISLNPKSGPGQEEWLGSGRQLGSSRRLAALWFRLSGIRKACRRIDPDLVLTFMVGANLNVGTALLGTSVPCVFSERSYPPLLDSHRTVSLKKVWRKLIYRRSASVICMTEAAGAWIRQNTWAPKVAVIPNPLLLPLERREPIIDVSAFRQDHGISSFVLAAGRLHPVKGFDSLIESFSMIAARHPDWSLVIVGSGPIRPELLKLIDDNGLSGRVFLVGRVGNPADWFQAADAFALSSKFEGFGNVLVEAMAHGCPVVSVNCPVGPGEIIRDGVDGVLVPPDDPVALASGLDRLMTDDNLRSRLSASAVKVSEHYALKKVAWQYESIFRELLG